MGLIRGSLARIVSRTGWSGPRPMIGAPITRRVARRRRWRGGRIRGRSPPWLDGRVVMQRTANPCTPVRFRLQPPDACFRPSRKALSHRPGAPRHVWIRGRRHGGRAVPRDRGHPMMRAASPAGTWGRRGRGLAVGTADRTRLVYCLANTFAFALRLFAAGGVAPPHVGPTTVRQGSTDGQPGSARRSSSRSADSRNCRGTPPCAPRSANARAVQHWCCDIAIACWRQPVAWRKAVSSASHLTAAPSSAAWRSSTAAASRRCSVAG